jgi:hypothetical protein
VSDSNRRTSKDLRLYVKDPKTCEVRVKQSAERAYCYLQDPDQDYFHLILSGELYVQRGHERYCFNCARRMGLLTDNRMHWERRKRSE